MGTRRLRQSFCADVAADSLIRNGLVDGEDRGIVNRLDTLREVSKALIPDQGSDHSQDLDSHDTTVEHIKLRGSHSNLVTCAGLELKLFKVESTLFDVNAKDIHISRSHFGIGKDSDNKVLIICNDFPYHTKLKFLVVDVYFILSYVEVEPGSIIASLIGNSHEIPVALLRYEFKVAAAEVFCFQVTHDCQFLTVARIGHR